MLKVILYKLKMANRMDTEFILNNRPKRDFFPDIGLQFTSIRPILKKFTFSIILLFSI